VKCMKYSQIAASAMLASSLYGQSSNVIVIAIEGEYASSGSPNIVFKNIDAVGNYSLNNDGDIAFIARREDTDEIADPDTGVWLYEDGDTARSVNALYFERTSSPADIYGTPLLSNNIGTTIFDGGLNLSPAPTTFFRNGLSFYDLSYLCGLGPDVCNGLPVDTPSGIQSAFGAELSYMLNDVDEILFGTSIDGGTTPGLWVTDFTTTPSRYIAMSNESAPGGGNFSFFSSFFGRISDAVEGAGLVAFEATVDTGMGELRGIWAETGSSNALQRIALQGDPLPGSSGRYFADQSSQNRALPLGYPYINMSGHVAFDVGLSDNGQAALFHDGTTLHTIIATGDESGLFDSSSNPLLVGGTVQVLGLNASGQVLVYFNLGTTVGTLAPASLWVWTPEQSTTPASFRLVASAIPEGTAIDVFEQVLPHAAINSSGEVAFIAIAQDDTSSNEALWFAPENSQPTRSLFVGQQVYAAGASDMRRISQVFDIVSYNQLPRGDNRSVILNDNGEMAWVAELEGKAALLKVLPPAVPSICIGDIADEFGTLGADGEVGFGDYLALLGLIGLCPGGTPGCTGDIADEFGNLGGDGVVDFGDFLALVSLIGSCP
jgi:hypothetical protein